MGIVSVCLLVTRATSDVREVANKKTLNITSCNTNLLVVVLASLFFSSSSTTGGDLGLIEAMDIYFVFYCKTRMDADEVEKICE